MPIKETKFEKFLDIIHWYQIENIFTNWIYPAYDLRNLLIHRHDRIKIPQVKPWEYTDFNYFMLCANMEMIVKFIELEKPEEHVCWYKDNLGQDVGHKYGEYPNVKWLFPEYNGVYIMDIIKEIYKWWKEDYIILKKDYDYILGFWCDYISGKFIYEETDDGLVELKTDKSNLPKTIEEMKNLKGINWNIINKYLKNESDLLDEREFMDNILKELENRIFNEEQKYLHLCIEVRPYLWT